MLAVWNELKVVGALAFGPYIVLKLGS